LCKILDDMSDAQINTYHIKMEDNKQELKQDLLRNLYHSIDSKAREIAPEPIRNELRISHDKRLNTVFYLSVSNRMAPYLLEAIENRLEP